MNVDTPSVLVSLSQSNVAHLLALRRNEAESIDSVLVRLCATVTNQPPAATPVVEPAGRYQLRMLGSHSHHATIADAVCAALKSLATRDSEFLIRLAGQRGRSRRLVARNPNEIHPGRHDLNAKCTREFYPGWWTGTNISRTDASRILHCAGEVAGLRLSDAPKLMTNKNSTIGN